MDAYFVDSRGNLFVIPDAPNDYTRTDATKVPPPPSPAHRWIDGKWIIPQPDAEQPARKVTYKADVWRRSTPEQAAAIDTELTKLDVRMRRLWDDAQYLDHSTEEFLLLRTTMIGAFGQAEADRILAPSDA